MDVILIGGENPIFIKEELNKTIASFDANDVTIYYGDELSLEDFFSDLRTGSLFVAKRMLVVRHANQTKSEFEKLLIDYLVDPSDTVCLVLEYEKIPAKVLQATEKLGSQRAVIHNFKKAWASDQKRYIESRLRQKEIQTTPHVINTIIDLSGEDIEEIFGMLDRLILYLGDRKELTDQDIHIALERAHNASIFDLTDAIFQRNMTKAFESFSDLLYSGETMPAINGMLLRSTRIMWAVKSSPDGNIPKGFAVSPYEWKKYQGFARNVNLKFIAQCFETISSIEIESKTKPEIFAQTRLESFLFSL